MRRTYIHIGICKKGAPSVIMEASAPPVDQAIVVGGKEYK
jgi:hypothetical protein